MTSSPAAGLRWNRPRVAAFVIVSVAVVVLLLALVAAFAQRGEARPGTRIDGVDIGGYDRARVLTVVETGATERQARVLTVRAGDSTAKVSARTVGVTVDAEATADRALDARRGGPVGLLQALGAWVGISHDVDPVAELRERRLTSATNRVVDTLGSEASDGGFAVSTADDDVKVSVVEPRTGIALDPETVTQALRAALLRGLSDDVELPAEVTEPQADADAARAVTARAEQLLDADLVLRDDERELTLSPAELAPVLRAEPDGDGGLRLTVDEPTLTKAVEAAAEPLTKSARAATLRSPSPGVLLTAQGDATFTPRSISTTVRGGRTGYEVDVDAAVAAITVAVAEGRSTGDLPGTVTPVPTKDGDLAAVDQVIGTFTTSYPCCAPRARNIARMAEIVDGTVVAPGATFSLNTVAGQRTLERGFVEDGAIVGDRIEMQVGGGVSQFSTTLLNAVWFAGLPSLEHQPHTAYISRYPAGREATLDFGNIDNVWRNETKHPVVVRTATTAGSVTVALYGHTGERSVTSRTGPREPKKGGGFRVVVDRTVRDAGELVKEDSLTWTYRGPLKTEAEIKKEEKAKAKAKKKADEKAKAKASPSATPRD
jgi:vancomycin resistance protein YoaR